MKEVWIASAVRTPIGSFGGSLAQIAPPDLAAIVVKECLARAQIEPEQVDEVILGCVLQAGLGQNMARQAALKAGIPASTTAMTVNKVCGSGLKAVSIAAQAIMEGDADIIVAGGAENMSQAPFLQDKARFGYRMGHQEVKDSMIKDGLWCAFGDHHMGITAENIAEKWGISREEQDCFALRSQHKAEKALQEKRFLEETIPVQIPVKGGFKEFAADEYPRLQATLESLARLKPAFKKDGTVTAGNSSGLNDGASALLLISSDKAQKLGIVPLARFVASATAGVEPEIMGLGPVPASKRTLAKAGWKLEDLDLIELNEAFASQSIAVLRELQLDEKRVNVNGGAIALGHPIGASGARILVTLLYEMKKREAKKGLAALCIGGGQGIAAVVER